MIYSMTGYATVSEELTLGTLSVEVRSVNHRYLDIQFRLPDEMRSFEPAMRESLVNQTQRNTDCVALSAAMSQHAMEILSVDIRWALCAR